MATPLASTVAICFAELDHANVTPDCAFPSASFAVAVNCWVPFIVMDAEGGVTTMLTSGDDEEEEEEEEEEEPEPHPTTAIITAINNPVLIWYQLWRARVFIK
ncbi:MAG: hypothetical protein ABSD44_11630 [Terracidiphilus sp.]